MWYRWRDSGRATLAERRYAGRGKFFCYSSFWAAYPKRINVHRTEREIDAAMAKGAKLEDIVAGAAAYASWARSQIWFQRGEDRYLVRPVNFVTERRWLDDWSVKPPPERKQSAKAGTAAGRDTKTPAADRARWEAGRAKLVKAVDTAVLRQSKHASRCPFKFSPKGSCQECQKLSNDVEAARRDQIAWIKRNPPPPR